MAFQPFSGSSEGTPRRWASEGGVRKALRLEWVSGTTSDTEVLADPVVVPSEVAQWVYLGADFALDPEEEPRKPAPPAPFSDEPFRAPRRRFLKEGR